MEETKRATLYLYSILILILFKKVFMNRKKKGSYIRPILQRRTEHGLHSHLVRELKLDAEYHRAFFRMSNTELEDIISRVGGRLQQPRTHRLPISPAMKIAMTIRYLATGDSQASVAMVFRVSPASMSIIVRQTCLALWKELQGSFLPQPREKSEWEEIANGFWHKWNFPNCLGAFDGKHVCIQAPPKCGSEFYNYKRFHSMVLMAACDANYCFTVVNFGSPGRFSDGGVFAKTRFGQWLERGHLNIPDCKPLPYTNGHPLPFVFVADEAFPLKNYLMRPFPRSNLNMTKKVFNYRLSRARRVIENSFGILAARWRIFRRPMVGNLSTVKAITLACIVLHNYLKKTQATDNESFYCPPGYVDTEGGRGEVVPGDWRLEVQESDRQQGLQDSGRMGSNQFSGSAATVRQSFSEYFVSPEGEVPWQYDILQPRA